MRDAFVSFILHPLFLLKQAVIVLLALIIAIVPFLVRSVQGKPLNLKKFRPIFQFLEPLPLGKHLFSFMVGLFAPYTGTIEAHVERFEAHEVEISMEDQPWKRNPYQSIHFIALANLGEFTTVLSALSVMQGMKGVRGIPISLNISCTKKARGTVYCVSNVGDLEEKLLKLEGKQEIDIEGKIMDASRKVQIATVTVTMSFQKMSSESKKTK
ncbi:hypothetical protein AAMO2058_001555800 [Amorphochlora amoebiformis]